VAALVNGKLVLEFGMHRLTNHALQAITLLSWLILAISWLGEGHPPLWQITTAMVAWFFCIGVVFGNINAMAMEQLGHVAGSAAAIIGTITTLVAVALGYTIGHAYDGTLMPIAMGFAILTTLSVALSQLVKAPVHH
jgi:DHA1 family bicyclomycin/chloramphenicol resistance-like MFS transporter